MISEEGSCVYMTRFDGELIHALSLFICSIRAMCGISAEKNCVHGSDSLQSAEREISFFFKSLGKSGFLIFLIHVYRTMFVALMPMFPGHCFCMFNLRLTLKYCSPLS